MSHFEIWCSGGAVQGRGVPTAAKYTERFWRDKDAAGNPFTDREAAEAEAERLAKKHGMKFSVKSGRAR